MKKSNPNNTVITIATLIPLFFVIVVLFFWWYTSERPSPAQGAVVDRTTLTRPHSPRNGSADAPVSVVEFFDPACETCRTFYPMVKQLMKQHPGRIQLVMRYAPFHQGSDKVVAVLEAARIQGKFWEALEALFDSQGTWASNHTAKVDLALKYLDGIGLNMEQLAFDVTAPEVLQAVAQDLKDANALGVSQTPEYFVNGRPLPTFGFQELQQLVIEELTKSRQ